MSGKGGNSISPVSSTRIQLEPPWTIVEPIWPQLIDYNGFNVVEAAGVELRSHIENTEVIENTRRTIR